MPHLEKSSENALKASSSWNRTLEGEGSIDEEVQEQREFRAGVDLHLGVINTTNVNIFRGRRREEKSEKSQTVSNISRILKRSTYAWEMHDHVTCKTKRHHGLSPIQSYQHTSILHTSKCMKIPLKCKWNAMYEVLNTFKWKPNPKFH